MLPVLAAGDHRETGMYGAALGGVVGDRISQFGIFVVFEHEVSVGPAALPGGRVGVQRAADDQAVGGDGVDAEQVAVGQGPAGFTGLDPVVVAGADRSGPRCWRRCRRRSSPRRRRDDAQGAEVLADAAVQLAAQRVVGRHQQRVGAVRVSARGRRPRRLRHLLGRRRR